MSHKNIKNSCVYNFKGICELNTCSYYRKRCKNVCYNFKSQNNKVKNANKKIKKKSNSNFFITFFKEDNHLLLRIIVPIKYAEFCRSRSGKYNYTFKSYQKEKSIKISISLINAESMILFLFSDFSDKVKVNSSILYITLDDIPEITNNSTSYRTLPNMIEVTKSLKNERGNIDICLKLNKGLVFSSIYELIHKNNSIDVVKSKMEISKPKNNILDGKNPSSKLDNFKSIMPLNNKKIQPQRNKDIIITAIVISDNRKCTYNNHIIYDVIAKANVVTPNGKIILTTLPAAYCDVCDKYIVLKQDFLKAKEQGVLLCSVEDKTARYIQKHANQKYKSIGESRIHKMGYNVRKDVGYTDMQRHVILANIIENTNIARHEILSVIDAGIARHKSKLTHQHAIQCWISDREFVTGYKTGDMPEVLIDKMVLKY